MNDVSLVKKNYIDYINNVINNNKISHAYLIELDDYNDDFKYVVDFIKMILCNISYEDIGKSSNKIINLINNENYPDITYISSDTSVIKKSSMIDLQLEFKNKYHKFKNEVDINECPLGFPNPPSHSVGLSILFISFIFLL